MSLYNVLAINANGEIVQRPREEQETVRVCPWCYSEAYEHSVRELTYCPECGCIEGQAKTITLAEWLEEHG